jgi:succinate dehydrogenase flavin-adding protein (antitoxin of CptAB toxin-antitoxin module)
VITNQTPRQAARPSRLRVTLARVGGALNRACDYGDRHIVAVALTFAAMASVALALLVAFSESRYGVAVSSLAVCASVAFFVFVATDDATARQRDAYYRARIRGILATHESAREQWNTYCDQVATRNEERYARALAQRDEALAALREMSRGRDAEAIAAQHMEDHLRAALDEARGERDDIAHLALRMSGIDLPRGVTISEAALAVFVAARGDFESCDDMTAADYPGAYDRIARFAAMSSPYSG